MLRPDGVFICTDADGKQTHVDSYMCGHCGLPRKVETKTKDTDIGRWCRMCAANICPACAPEVCVPFERMLEKIEARGVALRSYGLG